MDHKHKVEDTRARSILKALTGRALEISIGSFVIAFVFTANLALSASVALINEGFCAFVCYFNDRAWNRIQWGRKVEDVKDDSSYVVKGLKEGRKMRKFFQKVLEDIENIDTSTIPLTEEELKEMEEEMEMWQKASDEDWAKFTEEYNL